MSRRAFTLVELLVVIAIIGLLVALLLPAVQAARESARRSQCSNNLKQIALAAQNYHDAMRSFPPGYCASVAYVDGATDTTMGWGWAAFILPYMEQGAVYEGVNFGLPIEHPLNARAIQTPISAYVCPSDIAPQTPYAVPDASGNVIALSGVTSYVGCIGSDESAVSDKTGTGVFYRNSATRMADIVDGTSTTILVGEKAWANAQGIWPGAINRGVLVRGALNPCQPLVAGMFYPASALVVSHAHLNNALIDGDGSAGMDDFSSMHVYGSYFAFADGSVRFYPSIANDQANGDYYADSLIFQALGTRAGHEVIPGDWAK
ncbi:MAG TPA: DUF1559 domain-containing protein [Pirellulales bacterium]|nr:DUF1559 domain-containing protein [Pirellulales bacterium]